MPSWEEFFLGALAGGALAFGVRFIEERKRWVSQRHRRSTMSKAVDLRLSLGPKVVAFGGGTGLSTLLRGLKHFTRNVTAVVTVTDEGGSSGRLRQEWGVLPPGDIRNCLVALAEDDNALNRLLNFRFDHGELAGHSLGNLILLAATELSGDFRLAVEEMNSLLAIRGKVLPVTTEAVVLKGRTDLGTEVTGELQVSATGASLTDVWLEPRDARPLKDVLDAINGAEILVLGPGSLFTSVLPNLLISDVAKRLRRAKVPLVYVANLMTQPGETERFSLEDHIFWVRRALKRNPDYILLNNAKIPPDVASRYAEAGSQPVVPMSQGPDGGNVIEGNFLAIKDDRTVRHDSVRLVESLMRLVREAGDQRIWTR